MWGNGECFFFFLVCGAIRCAVTTANGGRKTQPDKETGSMALMTRAAANAPSGMVPFSRWTLGVAEGICGSWILVVNESGVTEKMNLLVLDWVNWSRRTHATLHGGWCPDLSTGESLFSFTLHLSFPPLCRSNVMKRFMPCPINTFLVNEQLFEFKAQTETNQTLSSLSFDCWAFCFSGVK